MGVNTVNFYLQVISLHKEPFIYTILIVEIKGNLDTPIGGREAAQRPEASFSEMKEFCYKMKLEHSFICDKNNFVFVRDYKNREKRHGLGDN